MPIRGRRKKRKVSYKSPYNKPRYKKTKSSVDRSGVEWTYRGEVFKDINKSPRGAIGFVYKITDQNGKIYFGKKKIIAQTWVSCAKSTYEKLKEEGADVKKVKNKAKSTKGKGGTVWGYRRYKEAENDWRQYTGSSIPLNEAIDKGVSYTKEILVFCYKLKQLTYFENKLLYCNEVLERSKEFYNDCISGKYFTEDLIN